MKNYPLLVLVTLIASPSQHKQRNLVWTKGTDALEGELQSSSEVDFYIDQVKKKKKIPIVTITNPRTSEMCSTLTQNECKVTPTTHQITG